MIKDKPEKYLRWFFQHIVERLALRHYGKISLPHDIHPESTRACLVLMNHYSFTDGPLLHKIARDVLKKQFRAMVIEAQLKAFLFLKYCGCFSVNKKSRDVFESLNYAAELLKDPKNMVGIFPQGEVYSMHLNQIHFESGLNYILKKSTETQYQAFFCVSLLDYLDSFKPHARVYIEEYTGDRNLPAMEEAYNKFYKKCKLQQQELHAPPEKVLDTSP